MNNQTESRCLYKFEDAKKIYFTKTMNKCFLLEKKRNMSVSLKARKTFIYNIKTGQLLFSSDR